jgi:hypothetical protein
LLEATTILTEGAIYVMLWQSRNNSAGAVVNRLVLI